MYPLLRFPIMRGVVLDVAGTVVDFGSRAPLLAMRETFAANLGITPPDAMLRASMGKNKREHLRDLCLALDNSNAGGACIESLVDALYGDLDERLPLWVAQRNEWTSPSVPRVLAELRSMNVAVGFCTGYDDVMVQPFRRLLDRSFGTSHGMPVVTASHVQRGRPHPDMAVLVAELMGVEPAHCLKVGDTVMDMQEGIAAGMRPIGVLDSGNEVGMDKDAWGALDDLEQDRMRRHASLVLTRAGAIATIKTVSGLRWFF